MDIEDNVPLYVEIVHQRVLVIVEEMAGYAPDRIKFNLIVVSGLLHEAHAAVRSGMVPAPYDKARASYLGSGHVTDEGSQRG